jgi:AcrR family transcriptional regulator
MSTNRLVTTNKSRAAILAGAKKVITEVGSYESNMNDIAARAEVSRATVYNHFSDKEEMMLTLVESEIVRLFELAKVAPTKRDALYLLSTQISQDPALAMMVKTDPLDIAKFVSVGEHPLWELVKQSLAALFGEYSELVLRWLIGQIASPLTPAESAREADQLTRALS